MNQLIHGPSHIGGHTLDLVCSNQNVIRSVTKSSVPWTDHALLFFPIDIPSNPTKLPCCKQNLIWTRSTKHILTQDLTDALSKHTWSTHNSASSDQLMDYFMTNLQATLDKLAPKTLVKEKNPFGPRSWFSQACHTERTWLRKAERTWKQSKTEANKLAYNIEAKKYKHFITSQKKNFVTERINAAKNSSKEIFKIVQELTKPAALAPTIPSSQEQCDTLAQ